MYVMKCKNNNINIMKRPNTTTTIKTGGVRSEAVLIVLVIWIVTAIVIVYN